jgi:hypothetical protein
MNDYNLHYFFSSRLGLDFRLYTYFFLGFVTYLCYISFFTNKCGFESPLSSYLITINIAKAFDRWKLMTIRGVNCIS